MIQSFFLLIACLWSIIATANDAATQAAPAKTGMAWLQHVTSSATTLSYSGVFVYRRGDVEETSRISRAVMDGKELERIEVLDGSPREVIRNGNEVKCFLPNENRLIIETSPAVRGFQSIAASDLARLEQNYVVRDGGTGRVAGTLCQRIALEPRDAFRYAHHLWVEPKSGLLLKSGLVDQRGQTLESFVFTQVSIGGALLRNDLMPSAASLLGRVQRVNSSQVREDDLQWKLANLPPGFRVQKAMTRRSVNPSETKDVTHIVISDGLAPVSVFIEETSDGVASANLQTTGAMSTYQRRIGNHRALVMGEVPPVTVKQIGDGIERR
jgi:sigma-E factor negative regulatory protein RseB